MKARGAVARWATRTGRRQPSAPFEADLALEQRWEAVARNSPRYLLDRGSIDRNSSQGGPCPSSRCVPDMKLEYAQRFAVWIPTLGMTACSLVLNTDSGRPCVVDADCKYTSGMGSCIAGQCTPPGEVADQEETTSCPESCTSSDGSTVDHGWTSDPASSEDTSIQDGSSGTESGSSGGSDGIGAQPTPLCANLPRAGGNPMIDDLEPAVESSTPDLAIPNTHGRSGSWYTSTDATEGSVQDPFPFRPTPGGPVGSEYAASLSLSGFLSWGGAFGLTLQWSNGLRCPYDASNYDGIEFWARGSGSWMVQMSTADIVPVAEGGRCEAECEDKYVAWLSTLDDEWTLFRFRWEELVQGGIGFAHEVDPSGVAMLQWWHGVVSTDEVAEISIDNVAFWSASNGSEL